MPVLVHRTLSAPESLPESVWRAHALADAALPVLATGDAQLDAQLPGGGWPLGTLTEVLQPAGVHCEWRLLLPALARSGPGPVLLVGAPHLPFAPALAAQGLAAARLLWVDAGGAAARLWATEQALRCAEVCAVLAWLPQARSEQLRRLQMAAASHAKLLFVMRPEAAAAEASPATLRLHVQPGAPGAANAAAEAGAADAVDSADAEQDALQVRLLKRRGPPLERALHLPAHPVRLRQLLAAQHALDRAAGRA